MNPTESRFGTELVRLTRRCRGIDKFVSSRSDLTVDELHCLSVLFSDHPSSVKRLSELINVSATRASRILKDLEDRGLVTRKSDAGDRRIEQVVLTESGLSSVQKVFALYSEVGNELIAGWRDELASDFTWLLQTVATHK